MKKLFQIKHKLTGDVIFSGTHETLAKCVESAVSRGASLRYAYLEGASLEGANLRDANLEGANFEDANL